MKALKMLAAVALLGATMTVPANATGAAVLFLAPFVAGETISTSSLVPPCTVQPSPVPDPSLQADTGALQPLSAGIAVTGCRSHTVQRFDAWELGPVTPLLAGMPAQIVAEFQLDSDVGATGTGDRAADVWVKFGDAGPAGTFRRIAGIRCEGSGCATFTQGKTVVVTVNVTSLPETLYAVFRSEASAADATGTAHATVIGHLRHVVVVPLLAA